MAVVIVHMWEGRSVEQKRRLTKAITDAMVEHADANPSGLHVMVQEYPRDNWARAGVLAVDRADAGGTAPCEARVFNVGHLLLQTRDLDASLAFYTSVLGLTVRTRETFRDGRPLVVTNEGLGLTNGRPEGEGPLEHLAFRARGIADFRRRAEAAGVAILRGPEASAYGVSLYLADPDGNQVEVFGEDAS
jgi:4-oxalocrotonate tautomerase